MYTIVQDITNL